MNQSAILDIIRSSMDRLKAEYHVKSLGLFGSFARGEASESSDVDMLVEFSEPIGFFKFIELESLLSGLVDRKVDLVTKNALKPIMRVEIQRNLVQV